MIDSQLPVPDRNSSSPSRRCSVISVPRSGLSDHLDANSPPPSDSQRTPCSGELAGAAGEHRHLVGDDERRIEADAELADQMRVLLLVAGELAEELARAGLGDRAEVRDDLVAAHADAVVGDGDRARLAVEIDADRRVRCRPRAAPALCSASKRSLSQASDALEISSRRKMSLLEYSEWIIRCRSCLTSAWKPRVSRVGREVCGSSTVRFGDLGPSGQCRDFKAGPPRRRCQLTSGSAEADAPKDAIAASRRSTVTGLTRCRSNPASLARRRSSGCP